MIRPFFGYFSQPVVINQEAVVTGSLYSFTSLTFTNVGVIGRTGPTQTQLVNSYSGSNSWVTSSLYFTSSAGIQVWTVPTTGQYRIKAAGAQGSDPTATKGGRGAVVEAIFSLTQGDKLSILVGQTAPVGNAARLDKSSPGGGGTFVVQHNGITTSSIYLVAGGGGGTGTGARPAASDANLGTTGSAGQSGGAGGINGNGGSVPAGSGFGAGAGFLTNGSGDGGGRSFVSGGLGGVISATYAQNGGGFGGGGSVTNGLLFRYSGGGGFSGGGSSTTFGNLDGTGDTSNHWGGGGGSFIQSTATAVSSSTGQYNSSTTFSGNTIFNLNTYNTGSGFVTVTLL